MAPRFQRRTEHLLSSCDVVVLGGFHGDEESSVEDERRVRGAVVGALERSGFKVGLASVRGGGGGGGGGRSQASGGHAGDGGEEVDDRRRLAMALSAAVDEGSGDEGHGHGVNFIGEHAVMDGAKSKSKSDESAVSPPEKTINFRTLVVVGLGAWGPRPCDAFLNDRILRASLRRFVQHGGVVLLHGAGGAIDEVTQGWFGKPWSSGVPKPAGACGWEYNDTSAWGAGYFARYNASPHAPPPSSLTRGGVGRVVGLESVSAAERVFSSRHHSVGHSSDDATSGGLTSGSLTSGRLTRGGSSSWYTAVALGAYGGGHVGFFGGVDFGVDEYAAGEAMLRVVAALVDAAPGVNSLAAQRQLRQWRSPSRGWGGWGWRLISGGGQGKYSHSSGGGGSNGQTIRAGDGAWNASTDDEGRVAEASMSTFVCYAVCSMTVTTLFVALLAWLILKS